MKVRDFFTHANIRKQLYTIYSVAVVVPIVLIGTFLIINTYKLLVNYHQDLLQSDNQRVRNALSDLTSQIYNISESISFNEELQSLLTGRYGEEEWYYDAADEVSIIEDSEKIYSEIDGIKIYTDNPYFKDYKQFIHTTSVIKNQHWYKKATSQSGVFWEEMSWKDQFGNAYWNLCLIRKIPLVNTSYHAVLVISVSDNYLRMDLDGAEYSNRVSVNKGPIFYSTDRRQYGSKQIVSIDYEDDFFQYNEIKKVNGKNWFVCVSSLDIYQSDSRLYICTINEKGYKNIWQIQQICLVIIALAIFIPGLIIHIFTKYFTERVNVLRQEMHKASRQDYELIQTFQGNDELSEAFGDLQIMVQKIKEQEAKIYSTQIKDQEIMIQQQNMEFKMLASQINPHFLYNTLETIRMKAFTAGDREVATAIKLLGKSMRYVLDNTGTVFTIMSKEIDHVETYIQIQKLRFGDRINYEKEIAQDVDLGKFHILPLLLQPVIENAIVHGLEGKEKDGHIALHIYRENMQETELLVIDVIDNGEGMDEEALGKLRHNIEHRDTSSTKSIGLYNINQRIKLHYGEENHIQIFSEIGHGTKVRLQFPIEMLDKDL